MTNQSLLLQQLNSKMQHFVLLREIITPPTGWIKAIRSTLGISMQQLGNKLKISRQAVLDMERREKDGAITIKSLREIGLAMDLQLVYGFVPIDGSLDALIEKKANEIATQIVMRTANTMQLEDQSNSKERIAAAIKERATAIKQEMPKILWD
jgi:predicted DNA-binding mobile mystery protein A